MYCTVPWLLEDDLHTYAVSWHVGRCSAKAWCLTPESETELAAGLCRCCLSESLLLLSPSGVVSVSLVPVSSFVCFGLN